jgi:hypothetical protein
MKSYYIKFRIRKIIFLFNKTFGWFFINGRKQLSWAERLRSEEIEILIMESRIKSRRKK